MGAQSNRNAQFTFTGRYDGIDGDEVATLIGFGGTAYMNGGDDTVNVGSINVTIHDTEGDLTINGVAGGLTATKTSHGNVWINTVSAYSKITHSGNSGDLTIRSLSVASDFFRSGTGDGSISFTGASAAVTAHNTVSGKGDIIYSGGAISNNLQRRSDSHKSSGNIQFDGIGGSNVLQNTVGKGNITFSGAGIENVLKRFQVAESVSEREAREAYIGALNAKRKAVDAIDIYEGIRYFLHDIGKDKVNLRKALFHDLDVWKYERGFHGGILSRLDDKVVKSTGNIDMRGAGAINTLYSNVWKGNIDFRGVGGLNRITHEGVYGNIDFRGAGVANIINTTASGNIYFSGVGIGNIINHRGVTGDITFNGGGGANVITTSASGSVVFNGAGIANVITRIGGSGGIEFTGAGAANVITTSANGSVVFIGGGIGNIITHNGKIGTIWFEGAGAVNAITMNAIGFIYFAGAGAANVITHNGKAGSIYFNGAGAANVITHNGEHGNIRFNGAGAVNVITTRAQGYVNFTGAGIGNIIYHGGKTGDLKFVGGGGANVIVRRGDGDMSVVAAGAANIIYFEGVGNATAFLVGAANVFVHTRGYGARRTDRVNLGGNLWGIKRHYARSYIGMIGAYNIVVEKSRGDLTVFSIASYNVVTKVGQGNFTFAGVGTANIATQIGAGDVIAVAFGGANIISKFGDGNVYAGLLGGANILTQVGDGNVKAVMAGGANILTKVGNDDVLAIMLGGTNILTQVGKDDGTGDMTAIMAGAYNIVTKVGDGALTAFAVGMANVVTNIGDGDIIAAVLGGANVITKVGRGNATAIMFGMANIFTHVDKDLKLDGKITGGGRSIVIAVAAGNILTKAADGDFWAFTGGKFNIISHIGDGMTVAAMVAKANILTKVGDGKTIGLMIGGGNIFTHVGQGMTIAAMVGKANVFTKVDTKTADNAGMDIGAKGGDQDITRDITAALMVGGFGIFTHVGHGISAALMIGKVNVFTKVGNGFTIAAMVGKAGIFTHVGDGISAALMIGKVNVFTKAGTGPAVAIMKATANIMNHVGDGLTVGVLIGKANILTKVGDGATVALAYGKMNVMTHIGDGLMVAVSMAKANIITAVGNAHLAALVKGHYNVVTSVDYSNITLPILSKARPGVGGEAHLMPIMDSRKGGVGRRHMMALDGGGGIPPEINGPGRDLAGGSTKADLVVPDGAGAVIPPNDPGVFHKNDFTAGLDFLAGSHMAVIAHGKVNAITKIGDGMLLTAVKGDYNVVTHVGRGLTAVAASGQLNVINKVGNGLSISLVKGQTNVVTHMGQGGMVAVTRGRFNIMTKIGGGASIMAASGQHNLAVKYGDGFHGSVMWGQNNVNVQIGDGMGVFAAYGRRNFCIRIGDGDFFGVAVATDPGKAVLSSKKKKTPVVKKNGQETATSPDEMISGLVAGLGATTVLAGGLVEIIANKDSFNGLGKTTTNPKVQVGLKNPNWRGQQVKTAAGDTTTGDFDNKDVGDNGSEKARTENAARQAKIATTTGTGKSQRALRSVNTVSGNTQNAMQGSSDKTTAAMQDISDDTTTKEIIGSANGVKQVGEKQREKLLELFTTIQQDTENVMEDTTDDHPSSPILENADLPDGLDGVGNSLAQNHQQITMESVKREQERALKKRREADADKISINEQIDKRKEEGEAAKIGANGAKTDAEELKQDAITDADKRELDSQGVVLTTDSRKTDAESDADSQVGQAEIAADGTQSPGDGTDENTDGQGDGSQDDGNQDDGNEGDWELTEEEKKEKALREKENKEKENQAKELKRQKEKLKLQKELEAKKKLEEAKRNQQLATGDSDQAPDGSQEDQPDDGSQEDQPDDGSQGDQPTGEEDLDDPTLGLMPTLHSDKPEPKQEDQDKQEKIKEQDSKKSGQESRKLVEDRKKRIETNAANGGGGKDVLSWSTGNALISVGSGNCFYGLYGPTNIGVKVGNGGFKGVVYGDNNIIVRIGNAAGTSHAIDIGGYRALEGVQVAVGKRNLIVNHGESNDLIVAVDSSVDFSMPGNPFAPDADGTSRVPFAGFSFMKDIMGIGRGGNGGRQTSWRKAQNGLYDNPKKLKNLFSKTGRTEESQRIRQEAQQNRENLGKIKMAQVIKETKKTGNIITGGQGADVILAIGNMNIIFGDTILSVLDTNILSLFDMKHHSVGLSTLFASKDPDDKKRNSMATLSGWCEKAGLDFSVSLPNITIGQLIGVTYAPDGTPDAKSTGKDHLVDVSKMVLGLLGVNFTIPGMHMYGSVSELAQKAVSSVSEEALQSANTFFSSNNTFFKGFLGFGADGAKTSEADKDGTTPPPGKPTFGENLFTGEQVNLVPPAISKMPSVGTIGSLVGQLDVFIGWAVDRDKGKIQEHFSSLGFLKDDGDIILGGGKLNMAWGGHGDDIMMLVSDWNRLFGGAGNDLGLLVGNSNAFAGGQGSDTAILIGQENIFFGDESDSFKKLGYESGKDTCFAFGNENKLVGGDDKDFLFAYGDKNKLSGGGGEDVLIAIGNNNLISSGGGDDFILAIGAHNTYEMGGGTDYVINFGNVSVSYGGLGSDFLKLAGSGSTQHGGDDNDFLVIAGEASNSTLTGGRGDDTIVVGGAGSSIHGNEGADRFIIGADHSGDAVIHDAENDDWIILGEVGDETTDKLGDFWFEKAGNDLIIKSGDKQTGKTTVSGYFGAGKDIKLIGHWWNEKSGNEPTSRNDDEEPSIWTEKYKYKALDRQGVRKMLEAMSAVSASGHSPEGVQAVRKTWTTHQISGGDFGVLRSSEYKA